MTHRRMTRAERWRYAATIAPVALILALTTLLAGSTLRPHRGKVPAELPEPTPRPTPTAPAPEPTAQRVIGETATLEPVAWLPLVAREYDGPSTKKGVGITTGISCEALWDAGVRHLRSWGYSGARSCPGMTSTAGVRDLGQLWRAIDEHRLGGGEYVITLNETDQWDQANVTPEDAVEPMHALMTAFPERRFGTPSQFGDKEWLTQYYAAYEARFGYEPDHAFVDCHCYWDDVYLCQDQVCWYMRFANDHGVAEVWLTEFAFGHWNPDGAAERATTFLAWLEDDDLVRATCGGIWKQPLTYIRFYDWFQGYLEGSEPWYPGSWYEPNLFTLDGRLTELGRVFREAR